MQKKVLIGCYNDDGKIFILIMSNWNELKKKNVDILNEIEGYTHIVLNKERKTLQYVFFSVIHINGQIGFHSLVILI